VLAARFDKIPPFCRAILPSRKEVILCCLIFAVSAAAISTSAFMLNFLAALYTLQFKHNVHRPRLAPRILRYAVFVLSWVKVLPKCILLHRILPPIIQICAIHSRFLGCHVVVIPTLFQRTQHRIKDAVAIAVKPDGVGTVVIPRQVFPHSSM